MARLFKVRLAVNHPKALGYEKGAFLQPSLFVWTTDGKLRHRWRQDPALNNMFGAANRPSPRKMVRIIRAAAHKLKG